MVLGLRLLLLPLLACALALPGCAYGSFDKPIRYYPGGDQPVRERVRHEGEYFVGRRPSVGAVQKFSSVIVHAVRGDRLGFLEEDGELFATAGERRYSLGPVPEDTQYLCWATEEHRAGATLQEAQAIGEVALLPVQVVAVVFLVGAAVALALTNDDEDDW